MPSPFTTTLDGGIDPTPAGGTQMTFTVAGNWAAGDKWSIIVTDVSGSVTIGMSQIFQVAPVYALTLNNKLNFVAGDTWYFSAIGDPTAFDPQYIGSGFIKLSDRMATYEDLVGLASYQGRMAVISRKTTQIWTIDADPTKYALNQVLSGVGALTGESIKSYGDMDVYLLNDTGVRSIRVRDSSLNAFVSDIGSSIDSILQSATRKQAASGKQICAAFEPISNRYMVFVEDTIYVLSYFPSSKIAAWSTYSPTYDLQGIQTAFQPIHFSVLDEIVWLRAVDGAVYILGGVNGTTYDACTLVVETPWFDVKKPATYKISNGVDVSAVGTWIIKGSTDYLFTPTPVTADSFVVIADGSVQPTFDQGRIPWSAKGTHYKLRGECSDAALATLSMFIWHYKEGEEK